MKKFLLGMFAVFMLSLVVMQHAHGWQRVRRDNMCVGSICGTIMGDWSSRFEDRSTVLVSETIGLRPASHVAAFRAAQGHATAQGPEQSPTLSGWRSPGVRATARSAANPNGSIGGHRTNWNLRIN